MMVKMRRWPYIVVPLSITVVFFTILLLFYIIPKSPWIPGWVVALWPLIMIVGSFIVSFVVYREKWGRIDIKPELRGLYEVNDTQAEELLLKKAGKHFQTDLTANHPLACGSSMRVGNENTEVYVGFFAEDIFPSDTFIAMAINKKNPANWSYEKYHGDITPGDRDNLLKKVAEKLASDPPGREKQIVERYDPATGQRYIETTTRPVRLARYAQEQAQKKPLL